jgi:hypothetical protein
MNITIKDLIAGVLSRAAFGGGLSGSAGKIGLAGMFASGALPGQTGVSSQIGNLIQRTLAGSSPGTSAGQPGSPLPQGGQQPATQAQPIPVKVMNWPAGAVGQSGQRPDLGGLTQSGTAAGKAAQFLGGAGGELAPWLIIGAEVAKLPFELQQWGKELSESQRGLGNFNGQIAQSFAQLDVRRMFREMQTGKENADSIAFLNKQQNNLEENLRPLSSAMTRAGNYVMGAAEIIGSDIADTLTMLWDGTLGAIPGLGSGKYADSPYKSSNIALPPLTELSRDIAMGVYHKPQYPPLKHNPEIGVK